MARVRPNNSSSPLVAGLPTVTPVSTPGVRPTIHNVHILDASGSMHGAKYDNAVAGIREELETLKNDNTVNYLQTLVEFNGCRTKNHYLFTPMSKVTTFSGYGATCGTPLYRTINSVLDALEQHVKAGDKVLVKIFTDGEDNDYPGKSDRNHPINIQKRIKALEDKGYTVTFVGTKLDVDLMVSKMGIDRTNTLTHNNTAESVKSVFAVTRQATLSYSKAVADGLDVSVGFYSKSVQ